MKRMGLLLDSVRGAGMARVILAQASSFAIISGPDTLFPTSTKLYTQQQPRSKCLIPFNTSDSYTLKMASTSTTSTITNVNGFTIHRLKSGPNLPCFHDWVSMVIDEENGQIVAYGGSVRSSSEATNQFRILDVVNLSWQASPGS